MITWRPADGGHFVMMDHRIRWPMLSPSYSATAGDSHPRRPKGEGAAMMEAAFADVERWRIN